MKTQPKQKPLTFGDFVAGADRAWGKPRANGIIQLALKAQMIQFLGQHRLVIP
ncbi:MAG: hypothetical protein ABSG78_19165 [Verrucomicrobiota bacterium]|jgi:hypothetical protein